MANCEEGISKDVVSDCSTQPIAGTEIKAWMSNRLDMVFTYDVTNTSLITSITNVATKQLYTLTGVKNLLNPGSSLVTADDRANRWSHNFNFQGFEFDSASQENLDALDDIVIICEMKNKVGDDSTFRVFGAKNGLYPTTDEWTANDIDGARAIEIASLETSPEPYSKNNYQDTDYATTLLALVALETP